MPDWSTTPRWADSLAVCRINAGRAWRTESVAAYWGERPVWALSRDEVDSSSGLSSHSGQQSAVLHRTDSVLQAHRPAHGRKRVKLGEKDCTFKGEKICNGAVTKEIGTKLVSSNLNKW